MKSVVFAGMLGIAVSGCQIMADRDNKVAGATILGAGVGVLLASELYGAGTGGAIAMAFFGAGGAAAGYYLAEDLLPQEKQEFSELTYKGLETAPIGKTVQWQDETTGNSGSVTPIAEYTDKRGRRCRKFVSSLSVGAEKATSEATACRLSDSAWQLI